MIMKMVEQWVLMMRTFNLLLFTTLIFNIIADEYVIEVKTTNLSTAKLEAKYKSTKYLRSILWKKFSLDKTNELNKKYQSCWNDFIINKNIKYKIENSYLSKKSQNTDSFTFVFNYDLKEVKNLNVSKETFLNFCNKNKSINKNQENFEEFNYSEVVIDMDEI